MKKTKIIATLWPSINSEKMLKKLYKAWVNVIRFNFSHANYEDALKSIKLINRLNKSKETNLSMLLDTKGPEIRTWDLKEANVYKKWTIFNIYIDKNKSLNNLDLFCDYPHLIEDVKVWKKFVLDSWLLSVKVLEKKKDYLVVRAMNQATIWSRRHVNLPWVKLKLPWITKKDREDIIFAIENDFSFIAASFIRNAWNISEIKSIIDKYDNSNIKIISKIENSEAIENLDDIIKDSDGIMVARGDLWIEIPIKKLALYQKTMVEKARAAWKTVIIATHLLETMIENPFPTRAESSDVFNSVLQKPDCLMLSWETAVWKFPLWSVKMMSSIIKEAEKSIVYEHNSFTFDGDCDRDREKKILIRSGIFAWEELWAKALVIFTKSWKLARFASSYRPNIDTFAFTNSQKSVWVMRLLFWIIPIFHKDWISKDYSKTMKKALSYLLDQGLIKKKDKIIAINDIQDGSNEIPVMEIIDLKYFQKS